MNLRRLFKRWLVRGKRATPKSGKSTTDRRPTGAELDRMQLKRLSVVAMLLGVGFTLVGGMCVYLQGCQHEKLLDEAEKNYLRTLRLDTQRGDILDCKGEALATSVDVDTVYANPRTVYNKEDAAAKLAQALSMAPETVMKALTADAHFRYVKRQITAEEAAKVKALNLEGILIQKEAKRFYPKKELAGQVLGVVGYDSIGVEGVEASYESVLKGQVMEAPYTRDNGGNYEMLEGLPSIDEKAGKTLKLTIDEKIQAVAETELERAVVSFLARSGMAVVMDVDTGDVLAAAHYPRFNPNRYLEIVGEDVKAYKQEAVARRAVRESIEDGLPVDDEVYQALRMHTTIPRHRNRITAYTFEPGSIFKIITLASALEEGLIKLSDPFDTEGGRIKVDKKWVSDTHQFDRPLSVTELVKYSSNVGFIKIGNMVGPDLLYKYVEDFGFGSPTGVGVGGDFKGNVPERKMWGKVVLSNIAFGQGIAVTALQMTAALAALGNDGVLMKPRLVTAMLDADRHVIETYPPEVARRVVSAATAKTVVKALESVVEVDGTGHEAWLYDYDVAGKTGTAQKVDPLVGGYSAEHWTSSFIGLVPAKNPRLAISVIIDEPQGLYYGGLVAAPAFHHIAEFSLRYLQRISAELERGRSR